MRGRITESQKTGRETVIRNKSRMLWILLLLFCFWTVFPISMQAEAEDLTESEWFTADLMDTSGALLPKADEASGISSFGRRSADPSANWYGSQLSDVELVIYDAIVDQNSVMQNYQVTTVTDSSGTTTNSIDSGFTVDISDYGLNTSQSDYRNPIIRAIHAYIRDYGEMYWINTFVYKVTSGKTSGKIISVTLAPKDYYSGVRSDIGATDSALEAAVQKISAYDTTYEKVKAAHDYLVDLITYGNNDLARAHTITGGLLEKYGHTAVCECYAKLFRLLCTENGVPCVLVSGGSTTENGAVVADHMWNYVRMDDGYWYLVDCTWDDTESTSTYFLAGANSEGASGKKVSQNHMSVGVFSTSAAYEAFEVPTLCRESYGVVQEISLENELLTLDVENTAQIEAECLPSSAQKGMDLTYETSNSAVATVDASGTVTAVGTGTAVITVSSRDYPEVSVSCSVTVQNHSYSESGTVLTAATCTTEGLMEYPCIHDGCTAKTTGTIPATGHSFGTPTVTNAATCTTAGTTKAVCTNAGCTETKTGTIAATGHKKGKWKTVKEATALSEGRQELRCTVCSALIQSKTVAKLKAVVKLNASSLPMQVKKSTTVLKVKSYTTGDSVASWKSSNTKIVTVNSSGKLTAKKKGTATVTVTMKSGATASCKITVQKGQVKTTKLTVSPGTVTLAKGKSLTLSVTRTPLTSGQKVTYTSSNKKVATVNSQGKITAKKKGTATITVTSGSKKKKIKVTVK